MIKTKTMTKIIYAIKITDLVTSGLRVMNVKIGQTVDINSVLRQYRRSNPTAEILDLWEINLALDSKECENGVHMLAERYAYKRERETFIFLQESYQKFAENLNLLLKNITGKKIKSEKERKIGNKKEKPEKIRFCGREYKVDNWRDVLRRVAEEIYKEKKDFTPALAIRGKKRVYFSKDPKNLDVAVKIEGTPYFFEGRINADYTIYLTKKLLKAFGYNQRDLEIVI